MIETFKRIDVGSRIKVVVKNIYEIVEYDTDRHDAAISPLYHLGKRWAGDNNFRKTNLGYHNKWSQKEYQQPCKWHQNNNSSPT